MRITMIMGNTPKVDAKWTRPLRFDLLPRLEGRRFQLLRRWEQQLRFAVHGPGCPVASPRSHGVPRRDVPDRVHISMAGGTAGRAHEPRLALPRVRIHVPARRAPLARERGSDLVRAAGGLVRQRWCLQPPPRTQDPRFSPALARTFRPGFSLVPFADRVMLPICRFSTRITSNRRAMPVETFSVQSLRRSLSRAFSLAIACLTRPQWSRSTAS